MSKKSLLKVIKKRKLTKDSVEISFEIEKNLEKNFSFKPGQYLTLEKEIDGELIKRSYSICSSPDEINLKTGIKTVKNGKFSNYAVKDLKVGDKIMVSHPQGKFLLKKNLESKNIFFLAAGSGITPILSMIKSLLQRDYMSKVLLVYGNKSEKTKMFAVELHDLADKYDNFILIDIYSKEKIKNKLNGRINGEILNHILKEKYSEVNFEEFYICGPNEMNLNCKEFIAENYISNDNIYTELFFNKKINKSSEIEKEVFFEITLDNEKYNFKSKSKKNILDELLANGVDAPYSCRNGICSSCVCKVIKGEVIMSENQVLSKDEVEDGLILSCQSLPKSKKIILNFDDVY